LSITVPIRYPYQDVVLRKEEKIDYSLSLIAIFIDCLSSISHLLLSSQIFLTQRIKDIIYKTVIIIYLLSFSTRESVVNNCGSIVIIIFNFATSSRRIKTYTRATSPQKAYFCILKDSLWLSPVTKESANTYYRYSHPNKLIEIVCLLLSSLLCYFVCKVHYFASSIINNKKV